MPSKEEIEKAYWKGYIQKQNEAMKICKICKYKNKLEQLETDKQKLIEKVEEVCEKVDDEMADFEAIDLKHEILEILKGES